METQKDAAYPITNTYHDYPCEEFSDLHQWSWKGRSCRLQLGGYLMSGTKSKSRSPYCTIQQQ